jgi:hypothetical protein
MNPTLPPAFIDSLVEAFIATHFSSDFILELALKQLAQWRDGEPNCAIPGYDTPPADMPEGTAPEGWDSLTFHEVRTIADRRATSIRRNLHAAVA